MVGLHNDLNVIHRLLVFSRPVEGNAHVVSYETNINAYNSHIILLMVYIHDIYPD
jgi:hypothetical protein